MQDKKRPGVIFFDVNETLLDLQKLKISVAQALGGRSELVPLWFTTMLHYSLVSTLNDHYEDFGTIGAAALTMVARSHGVELTIDQAREAIHPMLSLAPHPDVTEALTALKKERFMLVSLTNSSGKAADTQLKNAGISNLFDQKLSIEDVGKYKPHPETYRWASKKLHQQPGECLLVAAHGWDIAGAQWAGWRSAFISRPGQQVYPLASQPELNEPDLIRLAHKLIAMKT